MMLLSRDSSLGDSIKGCLWHRLTCVDCTQIVITRRVVCGPLKKFTIWRAFVEKLRNMTIRICARKTVADDQKQILARVEIAKSIYLLASAKRLITAASNPKNACEPMPGTTA